MRRKNFKDIVTEAITKCFTAGTRIQTAEGEKNIEDIQVGDKVLAKDEKTGKQEYKEVVQLIQKQVDTIYQVHVGKEVIETTAEHPFWVAEKGWVQAKDLQPGDQLETDQGQHVKVTQIAKQEKQTMVYNFEVKDYHTYYVSGLHLLVHNMCGVDDDFFNKIYHYTDKKGAKAISESGVIRPDARGRVYLTTDKVSPEDANAVLFAGQRPGFIATHRVEISLKDDYYYLLDVGTQDNELIFKGSIRNGKHAIFNVKVNDFR